MITSSPAHCQSNQYKTGRRQMSDETAWLNKMSIFTGQYVHSAMIFSQCCTRHHPRSVVL